MKILDLFSGIGGISLGLERAGMQTVAFCEIEPFQRTVLKKHWPEVPVYEDIRNISADILRCAGIDGVDIIAGGFPCQDVSVAGKGAGVEHGERSGLWREMFRLIRELMPRWVLAENVPALRTRGADRVISDLEAAGYAVEPLVVGAWAVGAPHKRDRVWVIGRRVDNAAKARPAGGAEPEEVEALWIEARRKQPAGSSGVEYPEAFGRSPEGNDDRRQSAEPGAVDVVHGNSWRCGQFRQPEWPELESAPGDELNRCGETVGNASEIRRNNASDQGTRTGNGCAVALGGSGSGRGSVGQADASEAGSEERHASAESDEQRFGSRSRHAWPARPGQSQHDWEEARLKWPVGSSADGIPERLVRFANRCTLGAAGNSVVPQVVEVIGRAIMEANAA